MRQQQPGAAGDGSPCARPTPPPLPTRRLALSLGQLCAPNLMLLFLPVPHTSLVPWLTGLSRNALIRYHR